MITESKIDRTNELNCDADTMLEFFLQSHFETLVERYMELYEEYYAGSARITFIGDEWVYKIPLNDAGDIANMKEARHHELNVQYPDKVYIPIAPCEMLSNGALRMKRVEIPENRIEIAEKHEWTSSVDSLQVGFYKNELVAYDL